MTDYYIPANMKHLYNICTMSDHRRRRVADVVQILDKCFGFAGIGYVTITTTPCPLHRYCSAVTEIVIKITQYAGCS